MKKQSYKKFIIYAKKNDRKLLSALGIELTNGNNIQSTCPIHHNADNPTAFSYSLSKGIWSCFTHGCEKEYGQDIVGLIRSIKKCSFIDAIKWASAVLSYGDENFSTNEKSEHNFIHSLPKTNLVLDNAKINELIQDFTYLEKRKFKPETVKVFEGGMCPSQEPVYKRFMLPIRNISGELIGFTGRIVYPQCLRCKFFHPNHISCSAKCIWMFHKWHHFVVNKSVELYNIYKAKEQIRSTGECILVEGPLDVMALYQNGFKNAVSCFGTSFSFEQACLLAKAGCLKIKVMFDGDEAGQKAVKNIFGQYNRYFDITNIELPAGTDPADLI